MKQIEKMLEFTINDSLRHFSLIISKYNNFVFLSLIFMIFLPAYGQVGDSSATRDDLNQLRVDIEDEINKLRTTIEDDILTFQEKQEKLILQLNQSQHEISSKIDTIDSGLQLTNTSIWTSSNIGILITIALSISALVTSTAISLHKVQSNTRKFPTVWMAAGLLIGSLLTLLLLQLR